GVQNVTLKSNKENGSDKVWITVDDQFEDFPKNYSDTPQLELSREATKAQDNNQQINTADRASSAISKSQQADDFEWSQDLGEITVTGNSEFSADLQQYLDNAGGRSIYVDMAKRDYLRNLPIEQVFNLVPGLRFNPIDNAVSLTG
ncbi:MAG TPA: hypothetical protein DEG32_00895, partial [Balneolaceae bacterium]|nr:hypothetical protein [Balneolaceae bacterium]